MSIAKTLAFAAAGAALLAAGAASAQTRAPAAPAAAPKVFEFPEVPHPPPPPGAPTMAQALAAYLAGAGAATAAPAPAAAAAPAPPPAPAVGSPRPNPPILTIGPVPDPTHIKFMIPEDIPWRGREGGNQTYNIFGSPTEPGPYLQLMKWWPNAYSGPHMHPNTRNMMVVSGTWWVCACTTQDKTKTYPLQAGTIVTEPAYTYHWDGARNEPTVLILWGNGPSPNIAIDANGMPRINPPAAAPAAPAAPAAR